MMEHDGLDESWEWAACERRDELLGAFEHASEYLALVGRGTAPWVMRSVLERAAMAWLEPDDIEPDILIELVHDLARTVAPEPGDVAAMVDELRAFWAFAERELGYRHARACREAVDQGVARVLEQAAAGRRARVNAARVLSSAWRGSQEPGHDDAP